MAYQSNLLNDFWRSYRQKRIGTGQPLSQSEMGGLLGPMLEFDARKAQEIGQRQQRQAELDRQFSLQEQAQKDQRSAAIVGGVGQIAQLPMAYGAAKSTGMIPKSFELLKPGTWGGVTPPTTPMVSPTAPTTQGTNLMGGDSSPTAAGGATAMGQVGAAGPLGGAQLSGAAYPGIAGGTAVPGAVGEMSAAGAGAAAETAGAGLLGTASGAALPAAVGSFAGRMLGKPISKALGTHEKTTTDVAGVLAGAAAGAVAGGVATSWSGPGAVIGAGVGFIIGGISALF